MSFERSKKLIDASIKMLHELEDDQKECTFNMVLRSELIHNIISSGRCLRKLLKEMRSDKMYFHLINIDSDSCPTFWSDNDHKIETVLYEVTRLLYFIDEAGKAKAGFERINELTQQLKAKFDYVETEYGTYISFYEKLV